MTPKAEVEERLTKVSDSYIRDVLKATNRAFAHDEGLTDEQKRLFEQGLQEGVYYGTDIYSDWAEWRELLTAEAQNRGLKV